MTQGGSGPLIFNQNWRTTEMTDAKQQGNSGSKMIIGCRLPNGIVLEHPKDPRQKVTLNGVNKSLIKGSTYGITRVDRDFWAAWRKEHGEFPALKMGSIFEAGSEGDAKAVARDLPPTGLEPMRKDGKDKRAAGVKARDDKQPADE
jgi:hypothetical protein